MNHNDFNIVQQEYSTFRDGFDSLLMTTISQQGMPETSTTEFIRYKTDYYICLSEFSLPCKNLSGSGNARLLLIDDFRSPGFQLACKRIVLKAIAHRVARKSSSFNRVMELFDEKFTDFTKLVKSMSGYCLFKVSPVSGAYVRGYAQSYRLQGDELEVSSRLPTQF